MEQKRTFQTETLPYLAENATKVVAYKKEEIIKLYPYSWQEMVEQVKKLISGVTNAQINNFIRDKKIKFDKKYSAFNFRNKKQADAHSKSKKIPSGTPSIYNKAAVDFISSELGLKK